jgi:hypothetical protein
MTVTHQTNVTEDLIIVDRAFFTIKVYPDKLFAEYSIKADSVLNVAVAEESKRVLVKLNPGKKYYLLVGSEGFFRVTRKARRLGALKEFATHLAAVACYTSNASLSLLGELYNKLNKPAVPTCVFQSREAAEEWLREKMTHDLGENWESSYK